MYRKYSSVEAHFIKKKTLTKGVPPFEVCHDMNWANTLSDFSNQDSE